MAPVILYAEDDPDDRLLAELAVEQSGIPNALVFVEDGEEALEYLRGQGRYASGSRGRRPGVVLLDLNMPRLGGRETLAKMKRDPELQTIPVVIFSTSSDRRDVADCYQLGANTYVMKPDSMSRLVETMRTLASYWFDVGVLPPDAG
jgi:two-component system response regulator